MSTKPENLNRSDERVKSDTPQEIMARAKHDASNLDRPIEEWELALESASISALKEAGYLIVPVEITEAINDAINSAPCSNAEYYSAAVKAGSQA